MAVRALIILSLAAGLPAAAPGSEITLETELVHLRIDGPREWSTFADVPDAISLKRTFNATPNAAPATLRVRHIDVKQTWEIHLNGQRIGVLKADEHDMVEYLTVPAGGLQQGTNTLTITQKRKPISDDIRVGEIVLSLISRDELLSATRVRLQVVDAATGTGLPARLTVTNAAGSLQTVAAESDALLAVRPGVVYSSTGVAEFGLPAGRYTITAGRGFEYSIDTTQIDTAATRNIERTLRIRRVVPTHGYVACDTHVHSLTHSGHGDATVQERMITLAGEGIELPVATDHNRHIDHRPFAEAMRVSGWFTPVIGNEVTTSVGHFNIWPVRPGAPVPNHKLKSWDAIHDSIYATPGARISILNHARDLHGGTVPFGPRLHNSVTGSNLDEWPIRFNAMEVLNSGATQTDIMQLFHDWMGLLNAGHSITPVGSSDSHDVARYIVGQGRTYIRCSDDQPGEIDVQAATAAFLRGEVLVSYGLLCELVVDNEYRSGHLVPTKPGEEVVRKIVIRVLGPAWTRADTVTLFANGRPVRSMPVKQQDGREPGVLATFRFDMNPAKHDQHLVAIAVGPGIDKPFWWTAKPYQPDSPEWTPQVLGCSGAVWIDGDGDGKRTPAVDYARRVVAEAKGDPDTTFRMLAGYDESVAAQAAHLLQRQGVSILSESTRESLQNAPKQVRAGVERYQRQWRANQIARTRSN